MIISCQEANTIMTKGKKATPREVAELILHLILCHYCRKIFNSS